MKDHKLTSPSILSPKAKLSTKAFSEIFSSLKHHRCLSSKQSPYENSANLEKLRTVLNLPSACRSPKLKFTSKPESSLPKKKKLKSTPNKKKGKKEKKTGKIEKIEKIEKLVHILDKDRMVYAPKIFENQFFTDIYDLNGNHDRIMEVSQSVQESVNDSVIVKGKLEILNKVEGKARKCQEKKRKMRPPENSYLEETEAPNDIHSDLLQKLNKLALVQDRDVSRESYDI